ncbi:MAG: hypothetical protein D4R64_10050 [Porphyromonadaceae bacterium]|nr:MAG: hypothetical protein D4R64_10050 [Porphyromonadaceae bacterium]
MEEQSAPAVYQPGTFGYDLRLLNKHQKTVVLKRDEAMIALIPGYQGRVMTSASSGMNGMSFGWINYKLIESGKKAAHFNNYGGEERLWLGPEGGQFSIFFAPGVPFTFENWQVPAPIDTDTFDLVAANDTIAVFRKDIQLVNYNNVRFNLKIDRIVTLLTRSQIEARTGISLPAGVQPVAYETNNLLTNTGKITWTREGGLLSIWMLGQLISSPTNVVMVPFVEGSVDELGPVVNDSYFGKVPANRLKILKDLILFKADGLQRGKIGLSPLRAKNFIGSYDFGKQVLTILFYNKPDTYKGYVNSMWEIQKNPFAGDVLNSYNDGPLEDGSQLGPFYELEDSSPAAALKPGENLKQLNLTIHITGEESALNEILVKLFGITVAEIRQSFSK